MPDDWPGTPVSDWPGKPVEKRPTTARTKQGAGPAASAPSAASMRAATPQETSKYQAEEAASQKRVSAQRRYDPSDPLGKAKSIAGEQVQSKSALTQAKGSIRDMLIGMIDPRMLPVELGLAGAPALSKGVGMLGFGSKTAKVAKTAVRAGETIGTGLAAATGGKAAVEAYQQGKPGAAIGYGLGAALAGAGTAKLARDIKTERLVTGKEKPGATQKGQVKESSIGEHPGDGQVRAPAETGGRGGVKPSEKVGGKGAQKEETLVSAAYKHEGKVETGATHPEILNRLGVKGFGTRESRNTPDFGFKTSTGRFVTREEAAKIAEKSGQKIEQFDIGPKGKPVAHSDEVKLQGTSPKKASMARDLKELFGSEPPPDNPHIPWTTNKANALKNNYHTAAGANALSDAALNSGKLLTDDETAGIALRATQIKKEHQALSAKTAATNDPKELEVNHEQRMLLQAEFEKHAAALKLSKGAVARSLASQKMTFDDDYNFLSIANRAKERKGAALNPKQEEAYQKLSEQHQELQSKIEGLTKTQQEQATRIQELETQRAISRMEKDAQKEARSSGRKANIEDIRERRKAIGAEIEKRLSRLQAGIPADILPHVGQLARTYVEEGVVRASEIVDNVHAFLKNYIQDLDIRDVRDAISGYGKPVKPQAATEKALSEAKSIMRRVSKLEDAMAGQKPLKGKPVVLSEEVRSLQKDLDSYLRQQGLYEAPKKQPRVTGFPRTVEQRQSASVTRLQNSIKDLDARIKAGGVPKTREPLPSTQQMDTLKAQRAKLQEQLNALLPEQQRTRKPLTDEQRLKMAKARLASHIKDLEAGKPKVSRRELAPDKELYNLRLKKARLEYEIEKKIASERHPHPGDYVNAIQRFSILSGYSSAAKIGMASAERVALDTAENMFGQALAKVPGFKQIAEKAPSEGLGSSRTDIKAFVKAWNAPDMWKKGTTGISSVDEAYSAITGKYPEVRPTNKVLHVLELPGQIHGAIKLPAQRAAWERGLSRRAEYEVRQGNSLEEPAVQIRVAEGAYQDSLNAIFRGNNIIIDRWNRAISGLEKVDPKYGKVGALAGKAAQVAARLEVPIVRIPTNLAFESLQYGPLGIAKAATEIVASKGIKNLTPAQADIVMRASKKGLIGTALMTTVWFNADKVKVAEKKDDLRPGMKKGDMLLFGTRIPNLATHHPLIMGIKTAAIGRREYDKSHSLLAAAGHATIETAREMPFADQMQRLGRIRTEKDLGKHLKDIGRSFIPKDLADRVMPYQPSPGRTKVDHSADKYIPKQARTKNANEYIPKAAR